MSTYVEIIFWTAVVAIVYTYAGYPLLLMLISRLRGKPVQQREFTPSATVIIAAYNEERDLAAKLENTLALDYPKSKLEILVTSDCSTDRTDEIVRSFAPRGVRLHRQAERLGKTAAQNAAVEKATGEILLFSDATTHYRPDVLRKLVRSFADASVGCVTGTVIYAHAADSSVSHGTRSYWNYEFLLKKHESAITSLIGVCGCMYAVRKSAYIPLYHEACSDFLVATTMVRQGLRAVYEPEAICVEEPNAKAHKELAVRVRIITQTLADLWRNRDMLNPFRKGFYAVQLLSHKVMRYLVPLFLIVLLITSGLLAFKNVFYAAVFIAQVGFYLAAVASAVMVRLGVNSRLLALPQYFVITNVACLIALFKLLRGERYIKWEPVRERVVTST
ncbi:MAG TPA: glycosyltransferase family 2 protein [Pyrinomonadaceae bacterium]|nr:glycosyltransferase family 2 protein [Pyrinomonadaceae bacterium]